MTKRKASRMARWPAQGRRQDLGVEVSEEVLEEVRAANSVDQVT